MNRLKSIWVAVKSRVINETVLELAEELAAELVGISIVSSIVI